VRRSEIFIEKIKMFQRLEAEEIKEKQEEKKEELVVTKNYKGKREFIFDKIQIFKKKKCLVQLHTHTYRIALLHCLYT